MSDQLNEIQRTSTLTVAKAFIDVGGLHNTLVFILTLLFSSFIETSYYKLVARKIYKYNPAEFNEPLTKDLKKLHDEHEAEYSMRNSKIGESSNGPLQLDD